MPAQPLHRKATGGQVAVASPTPTGPEAHPWWFHPSRVDVRFADKDFRRKLHEFDRELECTWHPIHQVWSIWVRNPRLQNPIVQGWSKLFDVKPGFLDARVFARLWQASGTRWRDGKQYFASVEREILRDREKREQQYTQDSIDAAMPSFEHSKIQVAMRGKSNGSKFADYHA